MRIIASAAVASMALVLPACSCRFPFPGSMRPGAECRDACRQRHRHARLTGDTFDDRFPKPQFSDRFPTASESLPLRQLRATLQPQARCRHRTYRVASLEPTLPYQNRSRRPVKRSTTLVSDEILGLPLFRQQSALRRAVPQHLQGRPQRPSQLLRPGLLAGRDLQRQPRADARPRDFRRPASPA